MAGRRGLGALAFQFLSADAAHAWVHAYYNSFMKRQDKLTDYVTNPNIALTSYFMCAETDEEARRRADGIPFFQFALRFYGLSADPRAAGARHGQFVGRVREVEARQPRGARPRALRRPDRLARDDAAQAAAVRDLAYRPGHPVEPGRQEHARAHLREPRSVRPRGDARIPRPHPRAGGVEGQGV